LKIIFTTLSVSGSSSGMDTLMDGQKLFFSNFILTHTTILSPHLHYKYG
jgi:hypothetical protein